MSRMLWVLHCTMYGKAGCKANLQGINWGGGERGFGEVVVVGCGRRAEGRGMVSVFTCEVRGRLHGPRADV